MNSKRRLELQNQHNFQQLQQQQQLQQNCDDMIIDEPPFKKHRPSVAANFLYKVVELAAYTSAFATDAINTITGVTSTRQIYLQDDDFLQINDEDDEDDLYDQKIDKKDESAWEENAENVEEEEPPPPYDSTWSMPSPSSYTTKMLPFTPFKTPAISSSSSSQQSPQQPLTSQQIVTKPQSHTNPRRRQFRVRRGRRLLRRKSSSADMTNNFNAHSYSQLENNDEEEDIFLKFNCKLGDMIAEGRAALNSKVDVTDVEMMIAEEKERDERIMREFGIQTPINRRARRYTTNSSISSDYEYFSSILKN